MGKDVDDPVPEKERKEHVRCEELLIGLHTESLKVVEKVSAVLEKPNENLNGRTEELRVYFREHEQLKISQEDKRPRRRGYYDTL